MKKQAIIQCLITLLFCAGTAVAADFYVSPLGSAAGDGSLGDPWDLETALHHPPALQPGDTIWVRGGTYSGAHTSLLAGTEVSPITVRAYQRERVILDYAGNTNCNPAEIDECSPNNKRCNALTVPTCSHDVVLRDLELTNSSASGRVSLPAGGCTDAPACCYVNGVAPPLKPECSAAPAAIPRAQWQPLHVAGDRVKIVNITVHDGGTGIVTDQKALDTEIYGALVFNNGWVDPAAGQGPGMQIENASPSWRKSTKTVRNSVVWNNFGAGHSSLTSWGRFSTNLHLDEVVAFNNGAPAAAFYAGDPALYDQVQDIRYGNVVLQSDEALRFIGLNRCRLYHPAGSLVQGQYFGGVKDAGYDFHKDLIIEDSYLASTGTPLSLIRWQRVRTTGTTVVGGATAAVGDSEALVEMEKTECASMWLPNASWNALEMENNHYFFTGAGTQPFGVNTSGAWSYKTFAQWRTAISNRDATSTYASGLPTSNAVFVQPNTYEAGRAHVAIYNWQGLSSVGVDLSSTGLVAGQEFKIYNLQAFDNGAASEPFGSIVASGHYDPGQPIVSVSMTDTTVAAPIGLGASVPSTLPHFGAFLVRSTPCGDGDLNPGESCDDGNLTNGDGCDNNCTASACGNGISAGSEACDDGNPTNGDGCDDNCTVTACGNGRQTAGEACDDGNSTSGDGCDSNCTVTACGNAITTAPEACDDGNAVNGDACKNDCTANVCGDGTVHSGVEACDDGNGTNGDGCDNNCTVTACGNAIPTAPEVCDDGNVVNGDGCDSNCTATACGNTVVTAPEACDDGNTVNGDGCDNNCTATACGNTIVTAPETCDDGNAVNGDGCDNNCTATGCGNAIVTSPETCDDGNAVNGDGCDNNCTATACGNTIVTAPEACDDGNAVNGDGCDSNCTATGCGNTIVTAPETCDDGNTINGDGCDSNCTATGCGNGVRTAGEMCDDGNAAGSDGCEANCTYSPASGNGTVRLDPDADGVSAEEPFDMALTAPTAGLITISAQEPAAASDGFTVLGIELQITAPPATPSAPLVLVFTIDASLIPAGVDAERLDVVRNGVVVADCSGTSGTAAPDPCVASRIILAGGDVEITVLSSNASTWAVVLRGLEDGEEGCVNGMNAGGVKLAKAQAAAAATCLKNSSKGDELNAQACLSADGGGKVAAAQVKNTAIAGERCAVAPPFGFTSAAAVNSTAVQEQIALVADVFGTNLTTAAITTASNSAGAACQGAVFKGVRKLFETQAKEFLKCKKSGLAGKSSLMVSSGDLAACFDALAADVGGKIAKGVTKLAASITKKCTGVNLATALPGACATAPDTAACLRQEVSCRVCRTFNALDGLSESCDQFDDGEVDASCN